jgi:hypothetical protein
MSQEKVYRPGCAPSHHLGRRDGGKLIMECLLETKAATIVEFIQGLHGPLSLTFEEGTSGGVVATFAMAQCLTTSSVVAYPGKKSELEGKSRVLVRAEN